jgi:hypothetical protein
MINPDKISLVGKIVNSDQKFNYATIKSFNKNLGILYQFMMSLIRCYDYNLRYALIISEIEENRGMKRQLEETKHSKNFK